MILFFTRGEVDSDKFIRFGYSNYRDLIGDYELPERVEIIREQGKNRVSIAMTYTLICRIRTA